MRRMICRSSAGLSLAIALSAALPAWAVPYASGIRDVGGGMREFVLNESADAVTVLRDGANPVVFNTPTAGRLQFSMTGFTNYSIEVTKNAAAGWTRVSDLANPFLWYERPNGLAINTNPASPYFGTVYVANGTSLSTSIPGVRPTGDGIYALTADMKGVELGNNFAVVADANDTTQAKAPSPWIVNESVDAGGLDHVFSVWHMTLDSAGNLIVADRSDASGGIKYASPDLTSGGLVLKEQDGVRPLLFNSSNQEFHGSISSRPYVSGSIGNNLVVAAIDQDMDADRDTVTSSSANHVWRWNVGNGTEYEGSPDLVINVASFPDHSDGTNRFVDFAVAPASPANGGVQSDATYSPIFNKWYLTQPRSNGTESSLMIVTPDGVDGNTPVINWSSKQFSIDHNLDGFTGSACDPALCTGVQDIFRIAGGVAISPDGTKMYVHRGQTSSGTSTTNQNIYLGTSSAYPGEVLVIPLDANGLPVVQIDDKGNADPLDDVITNFQSIDVTGTGNHTRHEIMLDAAGNAYTTNNAAERVEVFSPGGNTKAITKSDGTFSVSTLTPMGLPGDFDGNHIVDARDYTRWRDNLGAGDESTLNGNGDGANGVDANDYNLWKTNFGMSNGSGAGAAAGVPEPASILFVVFSLVCGVGFRRRLRG